MTPEPYPKNMSNSPEPTKTTKVAVVPKSPIKNTKDSNEHQNSLELETESKKSIVSCSQRNNGTVNHTPAPVKKPPRPTAASVKEAAKKLIGRKNHEKKDDNKKKSKPLKNNPNNPSYFNF